jgi:hypothetical protein
MKPLRLLVPVSLLSIVAIATAQARGGASRTRLRTPVPEARQTVQWVFTARDLISCRTPAYALRHLRSQLGPDVRIVAYGIDVDEADARSFLRFERLDVELVTGSAGSYERQFKKVAKSGLYVLWGDSVMRGFPSVPGRAYPDPAAVQQMLRSFPPSAETRGRNAIPPHYPRRNS